ncbi:MAG TPA: aminoacyl-tRNA hydrolase, partial [Rhizobium sp.]|nr:aminoacyl-tRNA hydrolase [Rhizobium sp.]
HPDESKLMNKLALATGGKEETAKPKAEKPAGQSHIRQARNSAQPKKLPETGPMAEMLKRMFSKKED